MGFLKKLLLFSAVLALLLCSTTMVAFADENKTGTVNATNLNLRSGPSTSNSVICSLQKGQNLTILKTSGVWYNIKAPNGKTGWVSSTYVTMNNSTPSRSTVTRPQSIAASELGSEITSYAKKLLGVKYVWGGTTTKGFDCSGFVKYVFDHFNIEIDRVSTSQAAQGLAVNKSDLEPGDLVFFDTNGGHNKINHVGIYIGDGNFIHASSSKSAYKVVISSLTSGFYEDRYMRARRLL